MTTTTDPFEIIGDFLPMLNDHIKDAGLQLTTTGITINPTYNSWAIIAHCVDGENYEQRLAFTLEEITELIG